MNLEPWYNPRVLVRPWTISTGRSAIVRHVLRLELSAGLPYLLNVDDKDVGSLECDTGGCEYPQVHVSIVPLESRRPAVEK